MVIRKNRIYIIFILIIGTMTSIGCIEEPNAGSKQQSVIAEYNAYSAQYKTQVASYNKAVDDWNIKLTEYNDFISQYNQMSYFKQTSSSTQREKNLKASEVNSAGRNVMVESVVLESHINDILFFMEVNKDTLMKYDSQMYMQQKSFVIEQKARCANTEDGVRNVMSKL